MTDILSIACLAAIGAESILGIMLFPALAELKSQKDAGPRVVLYDNLEVDLPLLKTTQMINVGYVLEVKTSWNGVRIRQFHLQNIESET